MTLPNSPTGHHPGRRRRRPRDRHPGPGGIAESVRTGAIDESVRRSGQVSEGGQASQGRQGARGRHFGRRDRDCRHGRRRASQLLDHGEWQDLDAVAGPAWFWGDKNPLAAYVGKSVTVAGTTHANETELDVETVDGNAIGAPGKPPWAGGPWVVGPTHPGWKEWMSDGKPGHGHGRETAPGQLKKDPRRPKVWRWYRLHGSSYIRKTPNRVSGIGALSAASMPRARTRRVRAGR